MDQSNALHRLLEAADLIKMVEDLTSPGAYEKLSGASVSGLRITLRNVRETILNSHDNLAGNFVNKAKAAVDARANGENANGSVTLGNPSSGSTQESPLRTEIIDSISRSGAAGESQRIQMTRRDLRASLEKMVDR